MKSDQRLPNLFSGPVTMVAADDRAFAGSSAVAAYVLTARITVVALAADRASASGGKTTGFHADGSTLRLCDGSAGRTDVLDSHRGPTADNGCGISPLSSSCSSASSSFRCGGDEARIGIGITRRDVVDRRQCVHFMNALSRDVRPKYLCMSFADPPRSGCVTHAAAPFFRYRCRSSRSICRSSASRSSSGISRRGVSHSDRLASGMRWARTASTNLRAVSR